MKKSKKQFKSKSKILLILPSMNENKNLKILLDQIYKVSHTFNILIINDNTRKEDVQFITNYVKKFKKIKFFFKFRKKRLGVGRAHKDGLIFAYNNKFDYAITMDTDLAHDPKYIHTLLYKSNMYHLVVGSRFFYKESMPGLNFFRKFLSNTAFQVTKILFGHKYDSTNSFRCYNLSLLNKKFINFCKSNHYDFFFTSMAYFNKKNYLIRQFPMQIHGRKNGYSKMTLHHIIKSLLMVFIVYVRILFVKR